MANPVGRPPMYSDPEELKNKIDEYFKSGKETKVCIFKSPQGPIEKEVAFPTISGLVRYCGFVDRKSFYAYEARDKFSHTIKYARNRMEEIYEQLLQEGIGAGAIFALKNFGWKDESSVKLDGALPINLNIVKNSTEIKQDGDVPSVEQADDSF